MDLKVYNERAQAEFLLNIFPWATQQTKVKRHLSGPLLIDDHIWIKDDLFPSIKPGQSKTLGEMAGINS